MIIQKDWFKFVISLWKEETNWIPFTQASLCQIWLKLALWFWKRKNFECHQCKFLEEKNFKCHQCNLAISLLSSLRKRTWSFKLESPSFKDALWQGFKVGSDFDWLIDWLIDWFDGVLLRIGNISAM